MKRALIPLMLCVAGVARAQAPGQPPVKVTTLPGVAVTEAVPAIGTSRIYYRTKDTLWLYDRITKRLTLISTGGMRDIALSPKGDRIAFSRTTTSTQPMDPASGDHIWTLPLNPATGAAAGPARRVSVTPGFLPSFSPDGHQIAFLSRDSAGQYIAVVPASGGTERILDKTPRMVVIIRWSPDGKSIVFGGWERSSYEKTVGMHSVPVAGGAVTPIERGGYQPPGLSPDGRFIVTAANVDEDSLVVMTSSGRQLGRFGAANLTPWNASWNGNTGLLLYSTDVVQRLRAYSLVDGKTRTLTDSALRIWEAHWSPDGRQILMKSSSRLSIMNADGSGMRTIDRSRSVVQSYLWSPDGRWTTLVRPGARGQSLYALEVASGREVKLADGLGGMAQLPLRWARDSRSVFYANAVDSVIRPLPGTRFVVHQATLAGEDRVLREVVTFRGAARGVAPRFLSDSSMIYVPPDINTKRQVFVAPLRAGGQETVLHDRQPVAISEDGRRMVFLTGSGVGGANRPLEVMNADGSQRQTISLPFTMPGPAPSFNRSVSFLPDSRQLLVLGQTVRDGDISFYLAPTDGGTIKKLLTTPSITCPGNRGCWYELSPDGKTLLYLTDDPPVSTFTDIDLSAYLKLLPPNQVPR